MTNSSIGMGEQDRSEREKFENELKRILQASDKAGILLRVIGSLAFQMHCPQFGHLQAAMGRAYTDIDFGAYGRQSKQISELMASLGYTDNREVFIASEGERAIFDKPDTGLHVDIFYEKLDFCHAIYWRTAWRLIPPPSRLPNCSSKKCRSFRSTKRISSIPSCYCSNIRWGILTGKPSTLKLAAQLCANDWGLWRTTTMNLEKVKQLAGHYPQLTPEQKSKVESQVQGILARLKVNPNRLHGVCATAWATVSNGTRMWMRYKETSWLHSYET